MILREHGVNDDTRRKRITACARGCSSGARKIGICDVKTKGYKAATIVRVRRASGQRARGWLTVAGRSWPVTLGRTGIRANKREGDGATPRGLFRPLRLWWRADRLQRPATRLPTRPIRPEDGWCEDPNDARYNRPVRLRPASSADRLTRADHLYDVIVEIDHNTRPRVAGRGSAVFIHLSRSDRSPTAGCIGLKRADLLQLVARLSRTTRIAIE